MKYKIYIIEPSKVGYQHFGLLNGYLEAFSHSKKIKEAFDLIFMGSKATNLCLKKNSLTSSIEFIDISVIDPRKRRFFMKTTLEAIQVIKRIILKKKGDVILVTCLLPTSLILVEFANLILNKNRIYVILHGEIESISQKSKLSVSDIGFWSRLWLKIRSRESKIEIVVIDDFIKEGLKRYDNKIEAYVLNQAINFHTDHKNNDSSEYHSHIIPQSKTPQVCFIGFRTRNKGFSEFQRLAEQNPGKEFIAIGDGVIESIGKKDLSKVSLKNNADYLLAIRNCSAAIFTYTKGYSLTLSSAAMDALSQGVPIIALDRPFFKSLNQYFGSAIVDIKPSVSDISSAIQSIKVEDYSSRRNNFERLVESKYSINNVSVLLERMFINEH